MGVALVTLPSLTPVEEDAELATVGLPGGVNKSERFNYKGEWAKA